MTKKDDQLQIGIACKEAPLEELVLEGKNLTLI